MVDAAEGIRRQRNHENILLLAPYQRLTVFSSPVDCLRRAVLGAQGLDQTGLVRLEPDAENQRGSRLTVEDELNIVERGVFLAGIAVHQPNDIVLDPLARRMVQPTVENLQFRQVGRQKTLMGAFKVDDAAALDGIVAEFLGEILADLFGKTGVSADIEKGEAFRPRRSRALRLFATLTARNKKEQKHAERNRSEPLRPEKSV